MIASSCCFYSTSSNSKTQLKVGVDVGEEFVATEAVGAAAVVSRSSDSS